MEAVGRALAEHDGAADRGGVVRRLLDLAPDELRRIDGEDRELILVLHLLQRDLVGALRDVGAVGQDALDVRMLEEQGVGSSCALVAPSVMVCSAT